MHLSATIINHPLQILARLSAAVFALLLTLVSLDWVSPLPVISEIYLLLKMLALFIHEPGHFLLSPFGTLAHVMGGTLFELGIPLVLAAWFAYKKRFTLAWSLVVFVGFNMLGASIYIADARARALPLWGDFGLGGGDMVHDWEYILGRFGLLDYDAKIARLIYLAGGAVMVLGTAALAVFPEKWFETLKGLGSR